MVTREFVAKMSELDPSNSMKDDFCIEKYLIRQEKVRPFPPLAIDPTDSACEGLL